MSVTRIRPTTHRPVNFRPHLFRPGSWVTSTQSPTGKYRIADDSLDRYEAYVGTDADPDLTGAATATSATLPFSVNITPPGAGTDELRITVLKRNKYNLASLNQYWRKITIDSAGAEVTEGVTAPSDSMLLSSAGGHVEARSYYWTTQDSDPADTWVLYVRSNGTDPDVGVDSPVTQAMTANRGLFPRKRILQYILGPYSSGADVRAIIRVRRSSDSAESTNTNVVTFTVDTPQTPTAVGSQIFLGEGHELK